MSYANPHGKVTRDEPEIKENTYEDEKFTFVTWLIDVTGWRAIDEIFHIMAYKPNKQFSNYILPQCNINSFVKRQYKVNVVTQINGRRFLKDLDQNEIINTKNENCALIEFISWLEENRGNTSGIILLTYELNDKMPVTLLAALEKNQLLERFMKVVKGFANVCKVAKSLCPNNRDYTLKAMTKLILKNEPEKTQLTKTCYDLLLKLVELKKKDEDTEDIDSRILHYVRNIMRTPAVQKEKLDYLKTVLNKQNAWKPLFQDTMKSNWRNRSYSTRLRKCLVDKDVDFDSVQAVYKIGGKKSVITMLVNTNISEVASRSIAELVDCYFNSENRIVVPKEWSMSNLYTSTSNSWNRTEERYSNDIDSATADSADETEM